jgi:hypothetical protein
MRSPERVGPRQAGFRGQEFGDSRKAAVVLGEEQQWRVRGLRGEGGKMSKEIKTWTVDLVGDEAPQVTDIKATHYEVTPVRVVDCCLDDRRVQFFDGEEIVAEYRLEQVQGWRKMS